MYFEKSTHPSYTGTERYALVFPFKEQGDLYDVKGNHVQYTIRPDRVVLIWERTHRDGHFSPWKRRVYGLPGTGSRIIGPRVLKDGLSDKQEAYVDVFRDEEVGGRLTEYAASLPHLEQMITELESKLPA
jgi:hypothetical protein